MSDHSLDWLDSTRAPMIETASRLRAAVQDLSDREALRNLVVVYSMARDDKDVDTLVRCFAPDGRFTISGRTTSGHGALRSFYLDNMRRARVSLHTTHTHLLATRNDRASGVVAGHAEVTAGSDVLVSAYRYDDEYARIEDRWVFTARRLRWIYSLPVRDYATSFDHGLRVRYPGAEPVLADLPEGLPFFAVHDGATHD